MFLAEKKRSSTSRKKAERKEAQQKPSPPSPISSATIAASKLPTEAIETLVYVPNFITVAERDALLSSLDSTAWINLPNRKLQNHGGVPHPSGMIAERLPPYLQSFASRVAPAFKDCEQDCEQDYEQDCSPPDQILVNSYERGGGISPHNDGPLYSPTAAVVSVLSAAVLSFHGGEDGETVVARVWLEPDSLLVFSGEAYSKYKHSIDPVLEDLYDPSLYLNSHAVASPPLPLSSVPRSRRVSLTFRRAKEVSRTVEEGEVLPPAVEEERRRRERWWRTAVGDVKREPTAAPSSAPPTLSDPPDGTNSRPEIS